MELVVQNVTDDPDTVPPDVVTPPKLCNPHIFGPLVKQHQK